MEAALRRVHRATGLVPLAAYVVFHAWEHWPVRDSRDALFVRLARTESVVAELLLVLLPLVVHAGTGLWLARRPDPDAGYASPAFRRLQIATGVISALFLVHHLGGVWLPRLREPNPRGAAYDAMLDHVGQIPGVALYAIGLGAVCTHLGQGIGLALVRLLGPGLSPRVGRALGIGLGVLVWLALVNELAAYAAYAPLL